MEGCSQTSPPSALQRRQPEVVANDLLPRADGVQPLKGEPRRLQRTERHFRTLDGVARQFRPLHRLEQLDHLVRLREGGLRQRIVDADDASEVDRSTAASKRRLSHSHVSHSNADI